MDLPTMTRQLAPSHPTLHDLLEDSNGKIVIVLGTGEKDAWTTYADSKKMVSRKVSCVEIISREQDDDVSIGLLQDFVEKKTTGEYRVFLVFSNSPTLPRMMKQFAPDCYLHQVRFQPESHTGLFRTDETPLPQADCFEKFTLGSYKPENVRGFYSSASLRRLEEATETLKNAIGDRGKLVIAYRDVRALISTEDFSLQPWQESNVFLPMLEAWTKLKEQYKAALRAFGEEREVILEYLDLTEQCQVELLKLNEAISQARAAKSSYTSPISGTDEAHAEWVYRHNTAQAFMVKAKKFAEDASERLEQEESPLGIQTVSTSVSDSWTQCLPDVTFDVTQLAKKLIQKVKTLASNIEELLAEDQHLLDSL
jgi:hypothetical protein